VPEEQLLMNPLRKIHTSPTRERGHLNGERTPDNFRNEPLTDFSRDEAGRAMRAALEEVGRQLGRTYPLVINGRPVSPPTTIDSVNPSHCRQVVGRCGRATVEHATQALAAAGAAFPAWRDTDPAERAGYLFRAADVVRRRRFEFAAWEVYECG